MTSSFLPETWKALFEVAKEYDLHELSLTTPEETITVRRGVRVAEFPLVAAHPAVLETPTESKIELIPEGKFFKVLSPLSGVFYRSPAPGAEPFVIEGEKVQFGDGLCIIEAMKVLNEITSESSGIIFKIIPGNGDVVNEGDLLFLIQPESTS